MLRKFRVVVVCLSVFGLSHAVCGQETTQPSSDAAPALNNVSSIQTQMDHGDFNGASVRLDEILKLNGVDATAYNRHQIVMMLVECRLHENQLTEALRLVTFEKNHSRATHDWAATAESYSLYALLFEAPKLIYTPTAGADQSPLNLLDPDQRKQAYDDLFQVKFAAFNDEMGDARDEGDLKIVSDTADQFLLVRCLEQVSKSSTDQSDQVGMKLSKWSDNFIHLELVSFRERGKELVNVSNLTPYGRRVPEKPAGFTAEERGEVLDIREKCGEIEGLVKTINEDLGHPIAIDLPQNVVDAANLITRIDALLTVDSRIWKNRRS